MFRKEMERRRDSAVAFLFEAINELDPITEETPRAIRGHLLELVESLHQVGEKLERLRFYVHDRKPRGRTRR